jgi:hypothetical protein
MPSSAAPLLARMISEKDIESKDLAAEKYSLPRMKMRQAGYPSHLPDTKG